MPSARAPSASGGDVIIHLVPAEPLVDGQDDRARVRVYVVMGGWLIDGAAWPGRPGGIRRAYYRSAGHRHEAAMTVWLSAGELGVRTSKADVQDNGALQDREAATHASS